MEKLSVWPPPSKTNLMSKLCSVRKVNGQRMHSFTKTRRGTSWKSLRIGSQSNANGSSRRSDESVQVTRYKTRLVAQYTVVKSSASTTTRFLRLWRNTPRFGSYQLLPVDPWHVKHVYVKSTIYMKQPVNSYTGSQL